MRDRPLVGSITELIYDQLYMFSAEDEENDWSLLRFVDVICRNMLQDVSDVVSDQPDVDLLGWEPVFNVNLAPSFALNYLAQFAGVVIGPNMTDDEKRDAIKALTNQQRGTPAAMTAAAQLYMTGSKRVSIIERYPDPYQFAVRTYEPETPNPEAVLTALKGQKPAGLVMDYASILGQSYDDLRTNYASYTIVESTFDSYDILRRHTPP